MGHRLSYLAFITAAVAFFSSDLVIGAGPSNQAEKAHLEELELRIGDLERRVKQLEEQRSATITGSGARPVMTNPGKWQDVVNWRQLRLGMSHADVRGVLGEPKKIDADGVFETWLYSNSQNSGYVQFGKYSDSGKVRGWKEP